MPAGEVSSDENEAGGFRITVSSSLLSINVWGYWPPEVAAAFTREATAISQKPMRVGALVLDASALKPQGAEGQAALRVMFNVLAAMGVAKGTFIADSLFSKMQLVRLLRECGLDQYVAAAD
jgi:hypothetical protein